MSQVAMISAQKVRDSLGFAPEKISALAGGSTRAAITLDQFLSIVGNWQQMEESSRPNLQGILPSPGEGARLILNYLLELKDEPRLLCLEVDLGRDRSLPDLRALWPAAAWWQEELATFEGARFENSLSDAAAKAAGGTKWRQA